MKQGSCRVFCRFIFLLLSFVVSTEIAPAQTCRAPDINLVILDKKGEALDPQTLDEPKFAAANIETFSQYDGGARPKSIKMLRMKGNAACVATLGALTLKHRGNTMKLIFDAALYTYNPPKERGSFRLFYESSMNFRTPPFQNGTFEYVFDDWNKNILAGWKKLSDKALTDEETERVRAARKAN